MLTEKVLTTTTRRKETPTRMGPAMLTEMAQTRGTWREMSLQLRSETA
jgi:hypothetical protein